MPKAKKVDLEKLKKLPPEQRIAALQEIESSLKEATEKEKKELQTTEDLLTEAEEELRTLEEKEAQEARERAKPKTVEEQLEEAEKEQERSVLERRAAEERITPQTPLADIQQRVYEIAQNPYQTEQERNTLAYAQKALEEKYEAYHDKEKKKQIRMLGTQIERALSEAYEHN